MRKFRVYMTAYMLILTFMYECSNLQAQTQIIPNRSLKSPSSSSPGVSTPGAMPKPMEPLQPNQGNRNTAPISLPPAPLPPPMIPTSQIPLYFHPGALVLINGRWEGGDHLFNLINNVGVFVEIIRPEGDKLNINEVQFQKIVEGIFASGNITPVTLAAADQPPLPFFQIQILIYPIHNGYVACCSGRLFESVNLRRITFDPGMAFQAITWEKQSLIVSPNETIIAQLEKNITDIAQAFIERFQGLDQRRRVPPPGIR